MYDKQIIELFKIMYNLNEQEEKELKSILSSLVEEDKKLILLIMWKKYKREKGILKSFMQKLKFISYRVKELKDKKTAEDILANI